MQATPIKAAAPTPSGPVAAPSSMAPSAAAAALLGSAAAPPPGMVTPKPKRRGHSSRGRGGNSAKRRRSESSDDSGTEDPNGVIRCLCEYTHDDGQMMIQCDQCKVWQHTLCLGIDDDKVPEQYFCPDCRPRPADRAAAQELQRKRLLAKRQKRSRGRPPRLQDDNAGDSDDTGDDSNVDSKPGTPRPQLEDTPVRRASDAGDVRQSTSASPIPSKLSREDRKLMFYMEKFQKMEQQDPAAGVSAGVAGGSAASNGGSPAASSDKGLLPKTKKRKPSLGRLSTDDASSGQDWLNGSNAGNASQSGTGSQTGSTPQAVRRRPSEPDLVNGSPDSPPSTPPLARTLSRKPSRSAESLNAENDANAGIAEGSDEAEETEAEDTSDEGEDEEEDEAEILRDMAPMTPLGKAKVALLRERNELTKRNTAPQLFPYKKMDLKKHLIRKYSRLPTKQDGAAAKSSSGGKPSSENDGNKKKDTIDIKTMLSLLKDEDLPEHMRASAKVKHMVTASTAAAAPAPVVTVVPVQASAVVPGASSATVATATAIVTPTPTMEASPLPSPQPQSSSAPAPAPPTLLEGTSSAAPATTAVTPDATKMDIEIDPAKTVKLSFRDYMKQRKVSSITDGSDGSAGLAASGVSSTLAEGNESNA